ncbi:hypothetical protein HYFRA_00004003 [Hymenoscyphus fraxineus]|uniref:Uncharacterized protein n=1 Tax=Hymenoscyphus fraxineus TaxID=746836 RepID=A0A9N9PN70_9HELO|nr:hypothetical protein HYFRA_00004003 [Hymenoscyphus fraxineus]
MPVRTYLGKFSSLRHILKKLIPGRDSPTPPKSEKVPAKAKNHDHRPSSEFEAACFDCSSTVKHTNAVFIAPPDTMCLLKQREGL